MSVKIKKLKSGKHALVIHHNGKRKQKTVGSLAAAQKAKVLLEIEIAKDSFGIQVKKLPTFGEVATRWLDLVSVSRALGTYKRYATIIRLHTGAISDVQVSDITRGDIRDLLFRKYKAGFSKSSIKNMHATLSGVFSYALDDELIAIVPTSGVLKRLDLRNDTREANPFTADEMDLVLSLIHHREFFETLYHTGTRVGELCALTWGDIDFVNRTISISKTAGDGQRVHNSTKTHIVRKIDISDSIFSMLVNRKKTDREKCFKLGIKQNLVFYSKRGKVFSMNTLRRRLNEACSKAGISHHTIHDVRHTTASILLSRGVPLLYVSKFLGHANPGITLRVYSHYMPSENKGMVNVLSAKKSDIDLSEN